MIHDIEREGICGAAFGAYLYQTSPTLPPISLEKLKPTTARPGPGSPSGASVPAVYSSISVPPICPLLVVNLDLWCHHAMVLVCGLGAAEGQSRRWTDTNLHPSSPLLLSPGLTLDIADESQSAERESIF